MATRSARNSFPHFLRRATQILTLATLLFGSVHWKSAFPASPGPGILPQGVVSPGLVGRWSFSEGSGTIAADTSGMGNNGTLSGGTWITPGAYGSSLQFNGTTDFVNAGIAGMPALNAVKTVSWYQRVTATPTNNQSLLSLQNAAGAVALQTGFRTSMVSIWQWGGGVLVQAAAPSTNAWHHIAYVRDATSNVLYIDGNQVGTTGTATQTGTANALTFGRYLTAAGGTGEPWGGQVDEIQIYNRALTLAEVRVLAAPARPMALQAVEGNQRVTLTWTPALGATSYTVYRGSVTGGPYTVLEAGVTGTTYVDMGLIEGVRYFYVVTAVFIRESPFSPEASAVPFKAIDISDNPNGDSGINDACSSSAGAWNPWRAAALAPLLIPLLWRTRPWTRARKA